MTKRLWPILCATLAVLLFGSAVAPSTTLAAFISSSPRAAVPLDPDALEALRGSLEDRYLAESLSALGLSAERAGERIGSLTDSERSAIMDRIQAIQAGGDITMDTTTLIILILVLIILI